MPGGGGGQKNIFLLKLFFAETGKVGCVLLNVVMSDN